MGAEVQNDMWEVFNDDPGTSSEGTATGESGADLASASGTEVPPAPATVPADGTPPAQPTAPPPPQPPVTQPPATPAPAQGGGQPQAPIAQPAPGPQPVPAVTQPPNPAGTPQPAMQQPQQFQANGMPIPTEQEQQILAAQRETFRKEIESRYTLTPEDAELFNTGQVDKVLPRIASNLVLDVYENVLNVLMQQMPSLMQTEFRQQQARQQAADRLFTQFPQLRGLDAPRQQRLSQIAIQLRQIYPQMAPEAFFHQLGAMASYEFGLPLQQQAPAPTQQPVAQRPLPPHQPAGRGAAAPTAAPASVVPQDVADIIGPWE